MVLLRHLLGDALRRLRLRQGRTLREVSASARVSLGYLSEVERGQKEASSELLASICSALGTPLSQVLREVSDNFALAELQSEPVFADVIEPAIEVESVRSEVRATGESDRVPAVAGSAPRAPGAVGQRGVPAPAVATLAGHPGRISAGRVPDAQLGTAQLGAAQLGASQGLTVPAGSRIPLGANGLPVAEPVFDQVTRTVREITRMVPV